MNKELPSGRISRVTEEKPIIEKYPNIGYTKITTVRTESYVDRDSGVDLGTGLDESSWERFEEEDINIRLIHRLMGNLRKFQIRIPFLDISVVEDGYEEGITSTFISRVRNNTLTTMNLLYKKFSIEFSLLEQGAKLSESTWPKEETQPNRLQSDEERLEEEKKRPLILHVVYNGASDVIPGKLQEIVVRVLPRTTAKEREDRENEMFSGLNPEQQKEKISELVREELSSELRPPNISMGGFTEESFNYKISFAKEIREARYNENFVELERGFRVWRSSDFISVSERLLTPGFISEYAVTIPLYVSLEDVALKMQSEGNGWKNFIEEMGVKAEAK